ncbi:MAG: hypothetical protein IKR17_02945, partial [Bacteroidales bacterium]|nr:hypothetical protein [Bacteroidales bacterium]
MKRILGLILAVASFGYVYAEDNDTSKCSIIVNQNFHGWTHCHSNPKPKWFSSSIKTINTNDKIVSFSSGDNSIIIQNVEIEDALQEPFSYKFANDSIKLLYTLDVANIKKHGHYVDTITIGYSKHDNVEDKRDAHCFAKKDEGYSFSLHFTIDDPIRLTEKNPEKHTYIIEDNEKFVVVLNDFYENQLLGRKFQYRVGDGVWNDFKSYSFKWRVSIRPKKEIEIAYEDIFGNNPQDEEYLKCSGKQIQIRVLKTLSGSEKITTPSNIVYARFYHKGPQFSIEDIRWPYCKDSVEVFVNIDDESVKHVSSLNGQYSWKTKHASYDRNLTTSVNATTTPNRYKLSVKEGKNDYLNTKEAKSGAFKIQLQLEDEEGAVIQGLAFHTASFSIPKHLDSIKAVQSDSCLFVLKGIKYHLYSTENPYVVLNITDNDPAQGRLPYQIYGSDGTLITTIDEKVEINSDLRKEFEEKHKYDDLIKEWAGEWYDTHKDLAKIEKITGTVTGFQGSTVKDRNIYAIPLSPNYSCTYLIIETSQVSNQKCTVIKGSCLSNYRFTNFHQKDYGKNPFYLSIDNKTWYTASTTADYELVQENNRFLILKNNSGYCVLDLKIDVSPQNRNLPTDVGKNISNAFIDGNGDIVYVDNKTIKLYKYQNGGYSWKEDAEKQRKVLFAPNSAKSVVYDGNNVKYTTLENGKYQSYREYYEIGKTDFVKIFMAGNAVNLPKDAFKERYERLWRQYYLQHTGFHISIKKINQNDKLTLIDNDGCSYTIPYRVNVLDDLTINVKDSVNPTNVGVSDGKATLIVQPGGAAYYYYNNKIISGEIKIDLTNLHWGDNKVEFTDVNGNVIRTRVIKLLPKVELTTTPQTCDEPNGAIKISGNDVDKCSAWQHKNPSMPASDEYWKEGLVNLKAGEYNVRGKFGDLWVNFKNQTIANKVFSLTVDKEESAPTIGGKGAAIIKVKNYDGNLSWYENEKEIIGCSFNSQDSTATVPLLKGTHTIVASDSKQCPCKVEATIDGPEMKNAEVLVENENGSVSMTLSAGFEKVSKHNLVLYNQEKKEIARSQNNELQLDSASVKLNDVYSLDLQYEVDGKSGITQTLNLFEDLTPLRLTTATQYTADTLRCYGTKDTVKVAIDEKNSNIGDKVEYKIGSAKWKTLSADGETEKVDADTYSITYKTDTTITNAIVKIVNSATYTEELTILPGKKYDHDVEFNDVVCLGKDKGSIVLTPDSSRTIESVWLRKDNVDYKSG